MIVRAKTEPGLERQVLPFEDTSRLGSTALAETTALRLRHPRSAERNLPVRVTDRSPATEQGAIVPVVTSPYGYNEDQLFVNLRRPWGTRCS